MGRELILDRDGTVLFCHYGASLTDVPEDCAAIQSLLEEMELAPGQEPEEDELPYEELQTVVAAESRPRGGGFLRAKPAAAAGRRRACGRNRGTAETKKREIDLPGRGGYNGSG